MATDPKLQKPSCLAKAIVSAIEGGIVGSIIGSLMACPAAISLGISGTALRLIFQGGVRSAFQLGGFLACFNGGICSMERLRDQRDAKNPFIVGGVMGVAGALPAYLMPLPSAPWSYRNGRALAGAGISSALLCSFFWSFSQSSKESHPTPVPAAPLPVQPQSDAPSQHMPELLAAAQAQPEPLRMDASVAPASGFPSTSSWNAAPHQLSSEESADTAPAVAEQLDDRWAHQPKEQLQDPWANK
eukprot:CAMPEP_0119307530 /NCGR_PEP_ID=MMETSP1333-20130426/8002_1 /TAXON_ID=418940 /ORGANISM="Scyphosphaera apsteinii, Strain RCC1455" /LENGTH=243 /DNA_ID=CAMNT_0007311093 /DNA_START=31 /DNA_END=762 /DNA_ORIENTATION=-